MNKFSDSFTPVPDNGFYSVKDYLDDWRKPYQPIFDFIDGLAKKIYWDYVHKDKLKASCKNFRRNK